MHTGSARPDPTYHTRLNILCSRAMLSWLAPGARKGIEIMRVCHCYKVFDHIMSSRLSQFSNHYKQDALPPWWYYCNYRSDSIALHG